MTRLPFDPRSARHPAPTPAGGYSLRKRLIVAILGASVLMWMVSLVLIVHVAWRETSDVFDDALKEGARLALVLGANMQSRGMLASPLPRDLDPAAKLKIYYQIVADNGRVLQRGQNAPSQAFSKELTASDTYVNVWVEASCGGFMCCAQKASIFRCKSVRSGMSEPPYWEQWPRIWPGLPC